MQLPALMTTAFAACPKPQMVQMQPQAPQMQAIQQSMGIRQSPPMGTSSISTVRFGTTATTGQRLNVVG